MDKQLWLDPTFKQPWSLTKIIKTHNGWLTLLGATIVLAMFILKDAYQESAGEIANTLSQARSFYAIESRSSEMENKLEKMEKEEIEIHGKLDPVPGVRLTPDEGSLEEQARERDIAVLENLIGAISDHGTESSRLEKIKKDFEEEKEGIASGEYFHESSKDYHTKKGKTTIIVTTIYTVLPELADLEREVEKKAETEQALRERQVHRLRIASYFLCPFGVIVGLLGKLYGDINTELET